MWTSRTLSGVRCWAEGELRLPYSELLDCPSAQSRMHTEGFIVDGPIQVGVCLCLVQSCSHKH